MSDRTLIADARAYIGGWRGENDLSVGPNMLVHMVEQLADRLEALTGGGGEPAAWVVWFADESGCLVFTEADADEVIADAMSGATKEPLYLSPPSGRGVGREEIARMIDPEAFRAEPELQPTADMRQAVVQRRNHAGAKAGVILALFSSPSLGGEGKQEDSPSQGSQNDQCADAGPSPRSHDGGPGYERGSIVWHSSDGDDGPDVGIQLGLGGGYSLYCGELSRATLEDHLIPESYPDGWWVTLYGPTDSWVIGAVPDRYAAQEAVEHLHGLMKSLPAAPDPQAQQDDAASILSDPHAVHLNMLRGGLAKLTPAQIGHLYRGEEAEAVIAELRRQNPKQDEGER